MSKSKRHLDVTHAASSGGANAPRQAAGARYPLLDAVRLAAMLDVVSVHVTGQYLFWGAGVPAFIVMSIALAVRKAELPTLTQVVPRRAARVMVPWLVWSLLFGLSGWVSTLSNPAVGAGDVWYPWMVLAGTRIHLWFLPFIFVAEVLAVSALRPLRGVRTAVTAGGAVAMAVGLMCVTGWIHDLYAPQYEGMTMASTDPQERARFFGWMTRRCWLYGTVSLCLGVALGRTLSASSARGLRVMWAVSLAMLAAAVGLGDTTPPAAGVGWEVSASTASQWLAQATAFAAVVTAFQFSGRGWVGLERVAALSMGVYLLHKWVDLRLSDALLTPLAGPWVAEHLTWLTGGLGRVLLAWAVTSVLVAVMRRSRLMRPVL